MKKLIALAVIALAPSAAVASSLTLSPASVMIEEGQTFTVAVSVNPTAGKAYTVRANLAFDPSKAEFSSFTFAPKWLPLSQEGYDKEDAVHGLLVKTAGYPGGITAPTALGTATFRAKGPGATTIAAMSESLILDANNKNAVSGGQGSVQVSISAAAPVLRSASLPVKNVESTERASTTAEIASTSEASADAISQTASVLAAFESAITFGTGSPAMASLATVLALLIIVAGMRIWTRARAT